MSYAILVREFISTVRSRYESGPPSPPTTSPAIPDPIKCNA